MQLTPVILLSFSALCLAGFNDGQDVQQCRAGIVTSLGAPFWVPSPNAKLVSSSKASPSATTTKPKDVSQSWHVSWPSDAVLGLPETPDNPFIADGWADWEPATSSTKKMGTTNGKHTSTTAEVTGQAWTGSYSTVTSPGNKTNPITVSSIIAVSNTATNSLPSGSKLSMSILTYPVITLTTTNSSGSTKLISMPSSTISSISATTTSISITTTNVILSTSANSSSMSTNIKTTSSTSISTTISSTTTTTTAASATSTTNTRNNDRNNATCFSDCGVETTITPVDFGPADPVILNPVYPPDIDMGDLSVLDSNDTTSLWYNGADDSPGSTTVRLSVEYLYPSVVLDHSIYIEHINCGESEITGDFNNDLAYAKAKTSWAGQTLIFITTSGACSTNGAPFFFVSSSVAFDDTTDGFTISGSQQELSDVFTNMDASFGSIDYTVPSIDSNSTSANGTISANSTATCGSPSSPLISGLPAVSCDDDFDATLNRQLGYLSADGDEDYVMSLVDPDPDPINYRVKRDINHRRGTKLEKRGKAKKLLQKLEKKGEDLAKDAGKAVGSGLDKAYNAGKAAVSDIKQDTQKGLTTLAKVGLKVGGGLLQKGEAIVHFLATGEYDKSLKIPFHIAPPKIIESESPWGDAVEVFKWTPDDGGEKFKAAKAALEHIESSLIGEPDPEPGIKIFCVDCGVKGDFVVTGTVNVKAKNGIGAVTLQFSGDMEASVYVGVDGFAEYEKEKEVELLSAGLPGLSIPDVLTIGPEISLNAKVDFDVQAEGQLMMGAELIWSDFSITHDLLHPIAGAKHSGWVPTVKPSFQAAASLDVEASLGLPIKLEMGIDIMKGKYKYTVALVDEPKLEAKAEFRASLNVTDTNVVQAVGDDDCEGISWDIGLANEVAFEITDGPTYTIDEYEAPPFISGCIGVASDGSEADSGKGEGTSDPAAQTTTSAAPQATGTLSCPLFDGQSYTDASGNNWGIKCSPSKLDMNPAGQTAERIIGRYSFGGCVAVSGNDATSEGAIWDQNALACWKLVPSSSPATFTPYGLHTYRFAQVQSEFKIYGLTWEDQDIMSEEASSFYQGFNLRVDGSSFASKYGELIAGNGMMHMLYTYQGVFRVYSSFGANGNQDTILPGPNTLPGKQRLSPDAQQAKVAYGGRYSTIYDAVWGIELADINTEVPTMFTNIYSAVNNDVYVDYSNTLFGYDGWYGYRKFGTIFVADSSSPTGIKALMGREYYQGPASTAFGAPVSAKLRRRYINDDARPGIHAEYGKRSVSSDSTTSTTVVSTTTGSVATTTTTTSFTGYNSTSTTSTTTNTTTPAISTTSVITTSLATNTSTSPAVVTTNAPYSNTTDSSLSNFTNSDNSTNTASLNSTSIFNGTFLNSTTNSTDNSTDVDFFTFTITDITGTLGLNMGLDGNLFVNDLTDTSVPISNLTTGASFYGVDSDSDAGIPVMIFGDDQDGFLHYFPSELSNTGGSRLRIATWDLLPETSELITLTSFSDNDNPSDSMLVALDSQGNYAWPYVCVVNGELNKVFLVEDPLNSQGVFQQDGMQYIVTGGNATSCNPLTLTATSSAVSARRKREAHLRRHLRRRQEERYGYVHW